MEYQVMAQNLPSDPFLRGYLECAEWCGLMPLEDGREGQEALELSMSPKWSPEALKQAREDVEAFVFDNAKNIEALGLTPIEVGHLFYLNRNGHGAGFWEYPGAEAQKLSAAAKVYGSADVDFDPETETLSLS